MNLLWWLASWWSSGTPITGEHPIIALRATATRVHSLHASASRVQVARAKSTRIQSLDAEF